MRRDAVRAERLAEYKGPKLGRGLRRGIREEVHSLHEKVMILRLLDANFERELEELQLLEFLDRFSALLDRRDQEKKRTFEELTRVSITLPGRS
jgi:hypothetical protein